MYLVENYALAVSLTVITMFCWGSWPNLQNLVKEYRFELFYLDFVIGVLLMALLMAFTFGSMGSAGRSFLPDLYQADGNALLSAASGGFIWSAGTILIVAGTAIAGMSVAFPIGGGIAWVCGIAINYFARPEGNPQLLFVGALFIFAAILLSMFSYRRLASSTEKTPAKGILISVLAGICLAFFYSFVVRSLDTDFLPASAGKLTPYTAVVSFSVGSLVCGLVFIPILTAKPLQGEPVRLFKYFKASTKEHFFGVLSGAMWGLGNSLSFMAANAASPAISYGLSYGAVVVAAMWGIFVWKEFRGAPKGTNALLGLMFVSYLTGLAVMVAAKF